MIAGSHHRQWIQVGRNLPILRTCWELCEVTMKMSSRSQSAAFLSLSDTAESQYMVTPVPFTLPSSLNQVTPFFGIQQSAAAAPFHARLQYWTPTGTTPAFAGACPLRNAPNTTHSVWVGRFKHTRTGAGLSRCGGRAVSPTRWLAAQLWLVTRTRSCLWLSVCVWGRETAHGRRTLASSQRPSSAASDSVQQQREETSQREGDKSQARN